MRIRIVFACLVSLFIFVDAKAWDSEVKVVIDGVCYASVYLFTDDPLNDEVIIYSPPASASVWEANCSGEVTLKDEVSF